jgi:hypothetical protein
MAGAPTGFYQLHLQLTVSPFGDVMEATAQGRSEVLKFWPQLQAEVREWKFRPFERDGKAITAEIEEYIDLVPPERLPTHHVSPPELRPGSKIEISLRRSRCFGMCPSYTVTVGLDEIVFDGQADVVALGRHTDRRVPEEVRKLAERFIAADFYSMDDDYTFFVTDMPTYMLSIEIDGRRKEVRDYVGNWAGMPAVITELEDEVDRFARTERWIGGNPGSPR